MTPPPIDKLTVYWLEEAQGLVMPEIVSFVEYRADTEELCFYDTQRPHALKAKFSGAEGGALVFEGPKGVFRLRVLDRAAFDQHFRRPVNQAPQFGSDEELQRFYRALFAKI